jgi:hypothetical protein
MQAASLTGVLNTILIIMLVYYGLKFVGKYLMPFFLQKVMKNVEKKFNQQTGHNQDISKEGETSIDRKPIGSKESNKDVGEYVDFEEVDE